MKYTPIRIRSIKPGLEIPFNLYIYFKETYLEYYQAGSQIEEEKYTKLKKQKIAKFYISDADEPKYQEFIDKLLDATLDDKNASVEDKVDAVGGAAETAMEKMAEEPASEASYQMTETAARKLRRLVMENPDALKAVFGGDDKADPVMSHSLNVCVLCIKFGSLKEMPDEEIDMLAMAALMHDVGVLQLDEEVQELFFQPKTELSGKQKLLLWDHTANVSDVLRGRPYVNVDTIDLVKNHEENKGGSGPNGKTKLEPMEEILSMINCYDEKIFTEKLSPADAMKNMIVDEMGNYELPLMQEFQKFLKAEGLLG